MGQHRLKLLTSRTMTNMTETVQIPRYRAIHKKGLGYVVAVIFVQRDIEIVYIV